jgi:hypothetical protein
MSKVVNWLCGLCKLVPNHPWSGFNINYPWMMVETVGRPVEPRNGQLRRPVGLFAEEVIFGGLVWMLDCQSLHCDIQKERMASTTEEAEFIRHADCVVQPSSKSVEQVSSSRFGSGTYFARGKRSIRALWY